MPFDAEGYRKAAREANISDDVIERTIAEQSKEIKDVATKPVQQDVNVDMFPNLAKQLLEYAPEAIGAYLGYKALTSDTAKSVGKSIRDRMIGAPKEPVRVEPTMEAPKEPVFSPPSKVGPITNMPGTPEELQKALGPNWEATLAKSEAARKEKQMLAQERARASMGELPAPTAQPPVVAPQPPAQPSPVAQVAAQTAPVAPPTVAQIAQQTAPAVTEAAQAPAAAIPPAEKNKGGRPKGVKTATVEERAAKEAAKGINMYRNMFGFEAKDPTSAKSLAAIEATNRLIAEGYEGKIPASRDPLLNPSTDVGASGKKFYSGTPEGYRNVYIPWLEKNLNTLPPETQAHVLESMTKGQTKDIGKIIKGLGLAGAALGAYDTAFAKTPGQRGMAGANVLGAVLPPGADITEAGAPVLPPNILAAQQRQLEEMQKLGSPYRKR